MVKKVLWLFSGFSYFMTLAVNKMDWRGFSNTACHACQSNIPKLMLTSHRRRRTSYLAVATRQNTSVIMMSGQMRSDKFYRRLCFSFTVII